jgi:hypothetical protein
MQIETLDQIHVLSGGHINASVTALDWYVCVCVCVCKKEIHAYMILYDTVCRHPFGHGDTVSGNLPMMIASGDGLGRVLIWNVRTGDPMAVLPDAGSVFGGKDKARVVGVSWVTKSHILAILLDRGRLILWDCKSTYVCVYIYIYIYILHGRIQI